MAANLALFVIAIGLSIAAQRLLEKKRQTDSDNPTPLATRGSFMPRVLGRRRLAPIVAWAGGRFTQRERAPTKARDSRRLTQDIVSFGNVPKDTIIFESAWHILCVGPAFCLWEIEQDGEIIFRGPITPDSNPSGSTFTSSQGTFRIFWGENDQPLNTFLGDNTRVGITSRWPTCCYIEWQGKRLGQQPIWPNMTYTVEVRVHDSTHLSQSSAFISPTFNKEPGNVNEVLLDVVPGAAGVGYLKVPQLVVGLTQVTRPADIFDATTRVLQSDLFEMTDKQPDGADVRIFIDTAITGSAPDFTIGSRTFQIGDILEMQADGKSSFALQAINAGVRGVGYIEVFGLLTFSAKQKLQIWHDTGSPNEQNFTIDSFQHIDAFLADGKLESTRIFPVEGVPGTLNGDGYLQMFRQSEDDGINIAHVLADLFFSRWPYGIKADKSEFDMASLETVGTLTETEGILGSIEAKDGQDMLGLLASIHQDIGIMFPMDRRTGQLKWIAVRQVVGTPMNIPADMITERPRIEVSHGPRPVDRLVFVFKDRANRFRDMPIGIDDDGQATFQEHFRQRLVDIVTTVNFLTAVVISQRRQFEELAGGAEVQIRANRSARTLLPGEAVTADGVEELLRITSVETDPLSGNVGLNCVTDFYGARVSDFEQPPGNTGTLPQTVAPDLAFLPVEVPEHVNPGGAVTVVVARIRAHSGVVRSDIFISRDDSTFEVQGADTTIMQGGTLLDAIAADDLYNQTQGPTIEVLGDDIGDVLDLSADNTGWRNGRQLVAIGTEVFYLQGVTALSDSTYRLDGLIRARFDTRPQAHAIGAAVFILQSDDGLPIQDVLIEPQVTLFTKSQPSGNGSVPLSVVGSESVALYGKGLRPIPVSNVRLDISGGEDGRGMFSYATTGGTDDLKIIWSYATPRSAATGAGLFGAGVPSVAAPPEGDFLVEILDSMDAVQRSTTVTTNEFTYTEVDRLADFITEPTSFKARVTQLRAGQLADPVTQEMTKL